MGAEKDKSFLRPYETLDSVYEMREKRLGIPLNPYQGLKQNVSKGLVTKPLRLPISPSTHHRNYGYSTGHDMNPDEATNLHNWL